MVGFGKVKKIPHFFKALLVNLDCSVAMKIDNEPKTNTKVLRFLKMDQRQISMKNLR